MADEPEATLYRMVLPDHTCPFGVRAKALLQEAGFGVDDRVLRSRQEVDALEAELGVDTTPQVFIAGERIGGCEDLEAWLREDLGRRRREADQRGSGEGADRGEGEA